MKGDNARAYNGTVLLAGVLVGKFASRWNCAALPVEVLKGRDNKAQGKERSDATLGGRGCASER